MFVFIFSEKIFTGEREQADWKHLGLIRSCQILSHCLVVFFLRSPGFQTYLLSCSNLYFHKRRHNKYRTLDFIGLSLSVSFPGSIYLHNRSLPDPNTLLKL